ncbi:MAG: hypothetical protein U9R11_02025 [Chloroflexota bacterium]|nr:hypothetical protein [Chloroflexota bacterium]
MWLYYNFFQPVMRLAEKIMTPAAEGQPTRVKRRYDQARTPFDHLCETTAITQERREQLEALRDRTNPRQLRRETYHSIDYIFSLPGAVPGKTEDVYQTLTTHADLEALPLNPSLLNPERSEQPGNIIF